MKKLVFLLLFGMLAIGCSKSDDKSFWEQLQSAPSVSISKKNLPNWLIDKINQYEEQYANQLSMINVKIYKGKWKNHTLYYLSDKFDSCLLCSVFYDNGKQLVLNNDSEVNNFVTTSKNWVLIYEIGTEL